MTPVITVTFSHSNIHVGTSTNVSCIAESYPPANTSMFYEIQHPIGETLSDIEFINDAVAHGVFYSISSASCHDSGPYACHVIVTDGVSDEKSQTLTVYGKYNVFCYFMCHV